jgi:hypothetical protein
MVVFIAVMIAGGALTAAPGHASATRGIVDKSPHIVAVSAFGSPLLPGKVTLMSTNSRRLLLSVSSVKILPVLLERKPEPKNWFSLEDNVLFQGNTLFKVVAPYLWFVAALFVLTLMARREVRQAAIPAPRPRSPAGPWGRAPRRG